MYYIIIIIIIIIIVIIIIIIIIIISASRTAYHLIIIRGGLGPRAQPQMIMLGSVLRSFWREVEQKLMVW